MRKFTAFIVCSLWQQAVADTPVEAVVVSIYRPLEMESRRVQNERRIFIRSITGQDLPKKAVGLVLRVRRSLHIDAEGAQPEFANTQAPLASLNDRSIDAGGVPLENGRPAGFAEADFVQSKASLQFESDLLQRRDASATARDRSEQLSLFQDIGQIRVLEVNGPVALATVVTDSLRADETKKPVVPKLDGSTVAVGDHVFGVIKKVKVKKVARALDKSEQKALKEERLRLEKAKRPKKKRGQYRRKQMKWDL